MKSCILLVMMIGMVLFIPGSASAAGLGEAGSMTLQGLVIGLAVLGIIFLVFMGLLLLARVRELSSLSNEPQKETKVLHFKPEDIMSLDATEISQLLRDRNEKTQADSKTPDSSS